MVSVENLCYSDRPLISTQEGIANSADPVHLSEEWLPTQKSDSPPLLSRLVAGLITASCLWHKLGTSHGALGMGLP